MCTLTGGDNTPRSLQHFDGTTLVAQWCRLVDVLNEARESDATCPYAQVFRCGPQPKSNNPLNNGTSETHKTNSKENTPRTLNPPY